MNFINRRRVFLLNGMLAILTVAGLSIFPTTAWSQDSDSGAAVSVIRSFYAALLDTMKRAKELGVQGRYETLAPAVDVTFDFPTMTRIAVGSAWSSIAADTQNALVAAFKRMTTATYANNFNDYNRERFKVEPNVQSKNGFQVVHTMFIQMNMKPLTIDYPMHSVASHWKAVDVYYSGTVSQLAQRRSEFTAILRSQGADGLLQRLKKLGDQLLKGS